MITEDTFTDDVTMLVWKHPCSEYLGAFMIIDHSNNKKLVEDLKSLNQLDSLEGVPYLTFTKDDVVCEEDNLEAYQIAWKFDDEENPTKVVVDLERAKKYRLDQIRWHRDQLLVELDRQSTKHFSNPDKLAELEAKKQELRETPDNAEQQLSLATTLYEISQIYPTLLYTAAPNLLNIPHPGHPDAQVPSKTRWIGKSDPLTTDIGREQEVDLYEDY